MKRYKTLTMLMAAILNSALAFAATIRCVSPGMVETVAFSPDGKTVASGGADRMVRIWDASDGKQLHELPIYDAAEKEPLVASVTFSPDGKSLAIGGRGRGKPITFWDPVTGKKLERTIPVDQIAWSIAFSPDGAKLAACDAAGITVWDMATKKSLLQIPITNWFHPMKVVFSPDGSLLATDTGGAFKSDTGAKYWKDDRFAGHSIAFSPDGKFYVTGGSPYYELTVWDLQTKDKVFEHADKKPGVIFCLLVSPDGKTIATGGAPAEVRLWDINTGKLTGLLKGHTDQVWTLAFSPDGKKLASGGADKSVLIWTLETDVVKPDANSQKELRHETNTYRFCDGHVFGSELGYGEHRHEWREWD